MVARSSSYAESVPVELGTETLTVRVEVSYVLEVGM